MKKNISIQAAVFFIGCSLAGYQAMTQPYLDVVNGKYSNSPSAGMLNQDKNDVKLQYSGVHTNIPVQFRNKKDALIFSPYYEKWWVQVTTGNVQGYSGIGLPVSFIKTLPSSKWGFLLNGILRMNDSTISKKNNVQAGGALVVTYKNRETLTWKLGLYMNNELFGLFVIPLAGIDWRINATNNLFGILPGNLTYEHKVNRHFYYGACFRAITNSYGKAGGYWRIDENQLGFYADAYLTNHLVLNAEAGHSLIRKMRNGVKNTVKTDLRVNDGVYFRLSLAYRVRFTQ